MKRHRITAFYMETLFLIAVLITVILVLTRVFGMGKSQSREAILLTNAVSLAQNAAEAVSGSASLQDVTGLLGIDSDCCQVDEHGIQARYNQNMRPDAQGDLLLQISWDPEETASGTLVNSQITIRQEQEEEPVYTLETAVFLR